MRTLIIDDEEDTRSIASMSLSILGGVEVIEAEGGSEGIVRAERERPDVILLDMMMPVMDGSQTLVELQRNPLTKDIPVIFLTAKAMSSEIERLKRMGAIGVLTKPFDPTTLATQVQSILASKGVHVTPNAVPSSQSPIQNAASTGAYPPLAATPAAPPPAPMQAPVQPIYHVQQGQPGQPLHPNPAFAPDSQSWAQQTVTSPYPAQTVAQYRQPYQNPFQQLANSQLPASYQQSANPQPAAQYPSAAGRPPNQEGLEDWQIMPPSYPEVTAQQIISGPLPQMPAAPLPQMPDQPVCSRSAPQTAAPLPYKQSNDAGLGAAGGNYPQADSKPNPTKQYATTKPEVSDAGAHTSAAHLARIVKEPKSPGAAGRVIDPGLANDAVPGAIALDTGTEAAAKKLPPRKKFQHPWGPPQMPNWSQDGDDKPTAEEKSDAAVKPRSNQGEEKE